MDFMVPRVHHQNSANTSTQGHTAVFDGPSCGHYASFAFLSSTFFALVVKQTEQLYRGQLWPILYDHHLKTMKLALVLSLLLGIACSVASAGECEGSFCHLDGQPDCVIVPHSNAAAAVLLLCSRLEKIIVHK